MNDGAVPKLKVCHEPSGNTVAEAKGAAVASAATTANLFHVKNMMFFLSLGIWSPIAAGNPQLLVAQHVSNDRASH
ncbi:MAG: hypothetical protein AW09_001562 [Candidatus Accumulibacter phosphatis]|uniref:Uncharacterized protein n=1 Tax=Candidatus Accumulibacter phosphatis TaxID=327160 RepID=A0A080LYX0_9PROT|nr:MAG: hypothetical protein AW09_001562 [Candidatus Accumulibacter phosphatis]